MDPVYAGAIAGMTLFFTGVVCGFGIYMYKECRTSTQHDYSAV
jgi:hypothetical protein